MGIRQRGCQISLTGSVGRVSFAVHLMYFTVFSMQIHRLNFPVIVSVLQFSVLRSQTVHRTVRIGYDIALDPCINN
jgi:hypothetical protein